MPRTIGAPALALAAGLTVLAAGIAVGGVDAGSPVSTPAQTATVADIGAADLETDRQPADLRGDQLLASSAGVAVEVIRPTGARPLVQDITTVTGR